MSIRTKALTVALFLPALLGACASAPPYQGLDADQLFELGAQKFEERDWGEAATVFERLIFTDPNYDRLVEARMYMARAYYNKGEYITATSEFTRILDRHPGHELAPQASLGICQSYVAQSPNVQRDQAYTQQAWNACQNTVTDFSGGEVAEEARILRDSMETKLAEKIYIAGDFYYRRGFYHSGIVYFNDLLEVYPRNKWAPEALLRLYQSYSGLNWDTEAAEVKERLLRDFPDSEAAKKIGAEEEPPGDGSESTAFNLDAARTPAPEGGGFGAWERDP